MIHISPIFWAVLGMVLIIVEIVSLSFVLLFFGASALLVAGAKLAGLDHAAIEIALFAMGGVAGLLLFRKKLQDALTTRKALHIDKETLIILSAKVPAKGRSDIQYQGTTWTALNESDLDLNIGDEALISRTDGVKLIIRPKHHL